MAAIVLDASVMVALHVEEPLSGAARAALVRSRESGDEIHAPDQLLIECANALWKRVDRGELDRDSAMIAITSCRLLRTWIATRWTSASSHLRSRSRWPTR